MKPFETTIDGLPVVVSFDDYWVQIDPRFPEQKITTAFIRPIDDCGYRLYTGAAVRAPNESNNPALGQKIALRRALTNLVKAEFGLLPWKPRELNSWARRTLRQIEEQKRAPEKLAAELSYAVPASLEAA